MTEYPLQRTFSLWCHNISVDWLKVCRIVLYGSLMILNRDNTKKTDFNDILINRVKFQNQNCLLKNLLFRWTATQDWFFSFYDLSGRISPEKQWVLYINLHYVFFWTYHNVLSRGHSASKDHEESWLFDFVIPIKKENNRNER